MDHTKGYVVYYEEPKDEDAEYLYEKGPSSTSNCQTSKIRTQTNEQVICQDEYDEYHYTLADPGNCKTEKFGALNDKIDEKTDQIKDNDKIVETQDETKEKSKKTQRKVLGTTLFVVIIASVFAGYFVYRVRGTISIP